MRCRHYIGEREQRILRLHRLLGKNIQPAPRILPFTSPSRSAFSSTSATRATLIRHAEELYQPQSPLVNNVSSHFVEMQVKGDIIALGDQTIQIVGRSHKFQSKFV